MPKPSASLTCPTSRRRRAPGPSWVLQTAPLLKLPTIGDTADPTKVLAFSLSGATAAKTTTFTLIHTDDRTVTFPDANTKLPICSQHITWSGPTAARTYTLPDAAGTIPLLDNAASFSAVGQHRFVEVTVSSAELLALRAAPKTLVAAEAGKVHVLIGGCLILDYNSAAYAEDGGGSNLGVRYENGSGAKASDDIESTGFVDQTADTMTTFRAKADAIVAKAVCENKALVLHNIGAGELVTGDSPMRAKVWFVTFSTGW